MTLFRQQHSLLLVLWCIAFAFYFTEGLTCRKCVYNKILYNHKPADLALQSFVNYSSGPTFTSLCMHGRRVDTEECYSGAVCEFRYFQDDKPGTTYTDEFVRFRAYARGCTGRYTYYTGNDTDCRYVQDKRTSDADLPGAFRNKQFRCLCASDECNVGTLQKLCPPHGMCENSVPMA